jgi:hypothetical protein
MKRSYKPLPRVDIISYGRYAGWNSNDRELPELVELTDRVEAAIDVEFGMIVELRQAKGRYIRYLIEHPPFPDEAGNTVPAFSGEYQIRTNPARFFLGDAVVPPVEDKKGTWELKIFWEDHLLAGKRIEII